jgi:hypothetical protein
MNLLFKEFVFQVEGTKDKLSVRAIGRTHKRKRNHRLLDLLTKDFPQHKVQCKTIHITKNNLYEAFYSNDNKPFKGPWCQYACINELADLLMNIATWAIHSKFVDKKHFLEILPNEMTFAELPFFDRVILRGWIRQIKQSVV